MSPFDGFVNPALAFGALLAGVPLLIHLLNRQRHKPMRWAAMRFVLAAYRRTRRRARLEDLLLLLLRMAAVALLAFAVARPFTGSDGPLGALTESRRDVLLVLDGSASTGYREEVGSVFERVVERAREIVLELDGGRGDSVRLLLAGAHPRVLSWRTPDEALSLLNTLTEPLDEPLDLAAALGEVARFAEEDAAGTQRSGLEVRVLTDVQRRSFVPPAPTGDSGVGPDGRPLDPPARVLTQQLDRLAALEVEVRVEDLGPPDPVPANLGVVAIELADAPVGPGLPVDVEVTVANHGPTLRAGVGVVLDVDGERRPRKPLAEVPARGTAKAVFPVVFTESGPHALEARVDADRLAADDVRARIVSVPPPVRALLVNGAPHRDVEEDEVGFLAAVLEPPPGDAPGDGSRPFAVRVVEPADLPTLGGATGSGGVALDDYDAVVLANVARISEGTADALEQWVASGGALIVAAGDQVDSSNLNTRLYRADGSGLLPAELGRRVAVASRRDAYFRVRAFDETHPALAFFADERWRPLLTEVPVYEFLSARPLESARVLASLDDEESSPLFVERRYDRGRVFLWLTTLDPAWTRLPESPRTLVPLVHELLRYAGRPGGPARNVPVGEPLRAEVRGYPRNLTLVRPDGSRRALDAEPEALGSNLWRLPEVDDTDRAGLFRIEIEAAPPVPFAVQLDPAEGDLARVSSEELAALHPALVPVLEGGSDADDPDKPAQGELWRWLAGAAFAALVLESLWAAWVGLRRSRPVDAGGVRS